MEEINYIISFYNGSRRGYEDKSHWRTFLDSHIDFIKDNMVEIGLVTFVISGYDDNNNFKDDKEMIRYLLLLDLPFNFEIHLRMNGGFSYGAFAEVIKKNHKDYKYSFIIEDDYIPSSPDFMGYFLRKFGGQVVYVSSLYATNTNIDPPHPEHASICNGMISNRLLVDNIDLLGEYKYTDYLNGGYQNQIDFMQRYKEIGYTFDDITDIAHTEFFDICQGIIKHGDTTKPLIIKPILV